MANLEEGQIVEGRVEQIIDGTGALLLIGDGIQGLLHVSNMSVEPVTDPSTIVRVGDRIRVKVLGYNPELRRATLGLKQLTLPEQAKPAPLACSWVTSGPSPRFCGLVTYMQIPYERLPPVDKGRLDGESLDWLPELPAPSAGAPAETSPTVLAFRQDQRQTLELWRAMAEKGLPFPPAFFTFLANPQIHSRVPTWTACYLDLAGAMVPAASGGSLLRFMRDQQDLVRWYLYFVPSGACTVAYAFSSWLGDSDGEPGIYVELCARSFEEFLYRFWMENTTCCAISGERPLTKEQQTYVAAMRRARGFGPEAFPKLGEIADPRPEGPDGHERNLWADYGLHLAKAGLPADALFAIDEALASDPGSATLMWFRGYANLRAGNREAALADLEVAAGDADKAKAIHADPDLAPLRGEPRFEALARR